MSRLRSTLLTLALLLLTIGLLRRFPRLPPLPSAQPPRPPTPAATQSWTPSPGATFNPDIDGQILTLTSLQCTQKFPGLFAEIEKARARGPIRNPPMHKGEHGFMSGRIWEGKLYVVSKGESVWSVSSPAPPRRRRRRSVLMKG